MPAGRLATGRTTPDEAHRSARRARLSVTRVMLLAMDPTALLIGALLLVIGLAVGVLIGRSHPGQASPGAGVEVAALLAPASDALLRVEQRLQEVERDRVGAYAGLREQVAALHRSSSDLGVQTRALVGALRAPQVRGRWGEVQLQRIVELAGMVEHCDFDTQVSARAFGGDGSGVRPDMIIRLSGGRQIPLDAKVPFAAWLEALDCMRRSPPGRPDGGACQGAARSCRRVGGEGLLAPLPTGPRVRHAVRARRTAAGRGIGHDPGLSDHAFARNVVIATPTSLIALLRTIAFTWRQERLSASAAEVHALGRELHGRLGTVAGHLTSLGAGLERAVQSYNHTVRSLETRVLVTARRFSDLGVTGEELPPRSRWTPSPDDHRRPSSSTTRHRRRPGHATAQHREKSLGRYR